jgi:hypothetical protein
MPVTIPAHLSHTGAQRTEYKPIDACIAPIVEALNARGILTEASCCGHGKGAGSIVLQDGRELVIRVAGSSLPVRAAPAPEPHMLDLSRIKYDEEWQMLAGMHASELRAALKMLAKAQAEGEA